MLTLVEALGVFGITALIFFTLGTYIAWSMKDDFGSSPVKPNFDLILKAADVIYLVQRGRYQAAHRACSDPDIREWVDTLNALNLVGGRTIKDADTPA